MVRFSFVCYILMGLCCSQGLVAQGYKIALEACDAPSAKLTDPLGQKTFQDSSQALVALHQVVSTLQSEGYLLAGISELRWQGTQVSGILTAGDHVDFLIRGVSLRKTKHIGHNEQLLKRELALYLNSGFPFARVSFDSAVFQNNALLVSIRTDQGPYIVFDSLKINGASKTKAEFLQKYLFIQTGTPYSEKLVRGIAGRINNTGYLQLNIDPSVDFYSEKARVGLVLEELQASRLDGVVGFLPSQNSNSGKLLLTGQIEAELFNLFGSGKHLALNWQNYSTSSQLLQAAYDHPVVLGSPVDFHGSFSQLKQDSAFVTRNSSAGLSVPFFSSWQLGLGVSFLRNNLLDVGAITDTGQLINADSKTNQYHLGFSFSNLNLPVFPTKGRRLGLTLSTGQKEISKNGLLDEALYAGVLTETLQSTVQLSFENYIKVNNASVFVQHGRSSLLYNKQLFQNDLFRVGGLKHLRGFNENQFYAQHYATVAAEYRFLIDQQSYLVSFVDQAMMTGDGQDWLYAVGFGGGIALKVSNGLFRLMLALGSAGGQAVDLSQPKVHFGFESRF